MKVAVCSSLLITLESCESAVNSYNLNLTYVIRKTSHTVEIMQDIKKSSKIEYKYINKASVNEC